MKSGVTHEIPRSVYGLSSSSLFSNVVLHLQRTPQKLFWSSDALNLRGRFTYHFTDPPVGTIMTSTKKDPDFNKKTPETKANELLAKLKREKSSG